MKDEGTEDRIQEPGVRMQEMGDEAGRIGVSPVP
jgi:hypothetical protein